MILPFKSVNKFFLGVLLIIFVVSVVICGYFAVKTNFFKNTSKGDVYQEFISESYDTIKNNYWDKISDDKLSELFRLGTEKLVALPTVLNQNNKQGVLEMVAKATERMSATQKKTFETNLVNIVAVNLIPFGRSSLYTQEEERQLSNRVNNINPQTDLYKDLGASKSASQNDLKTAYDNKVQTLAPEAKTSTEAAKQLDQTQYAYNVLSNTVQKQNYDQYGIEPTVFTKDLGNGIFYLRIKELSPDTFNEFVRLCNLTQNRTDLTSLIIDLRGNIGGSIDLLQYFLGPFIGNNRYAYDFYHQGNYNPFKTKVGWLESLVKFKKVVILVDGDVQSSAEVMVAVFKTYHVGVVVGTHTRGWGTVERVFPLKAQFDSKEKYSLFLVHSLTLRDDGQPIQGNGVDPDINTGVPDWQQQLLPYFSDNSFANTVKTVWDTPPLYSAD